MGVALKAKSRVPGRFALSGVAAAALCLALPSAWALGLGKLVVQSSLGEGLRAEIDVSSLTPDEASNLKIKIASPDAYKAAGVDYNAVLPGAQVVLQRRADGRPYIRITSERSVQEPFVDVILELTWNTGRLVREYTLLIDPPTTRTAQPAAPAAPAVVAAAPMPVPAQPAQARPAPLPAPARAAPEPRPAPPKPAPEPRPQASADSYTVKPGDTLSGIAIRTQPQGVSLDQMLVALFRSNADAFIGKNMNRLKAGAVLGIPDADTARGIPAGEARQLIQAQSADFAAYRERLASGAARADAAAPSRQASGKVEAAVEDRKQAAAATPDKLTLSKGGASAKASAPEDRLSKEQEAKDTAARTAELQKNVKELEDLAKAAKAASAPAATAAPSPAPAAAAGPAASMAVAMATPQEAASAPAATPAPKPAPKPASAAVAAAPRPAPAAEEPGLMSSLLDDPMALGAGGLVIALLGGYGVFRYVKRGRKDSGETSFLESRLQPDSFFGVSGGQRIDTREGTPSGAPSSMSYSLSQLDAIGDVDPVAEADVYLAYGRDLQAEEILKEAMRGAPERLAIRTKLLEVYAKRRDAKGFEQLAVQLYGLTGGQGEEWAKAQELGQQIDPENPLYQPGAQPELAPATGERPAEPLGASTMPQSVLPSPSQFEKMAAATAVLPVASGADGEVDLDLDLDLDLPSSGAAHPPQPPEVTQPMAAAEVVAPPGEEKFASFELPLETPPTAEAPPEPASREQSLDFDLGGISLDLDAAGTPPSAPAAAESLELPDLDTPGSDDPFERKLELAEEFRQIGDLDGARDLLQEVIAQTGGAIQAKARNMLERLG